VEEVAKPPPEAPEERVHYLVVVDGLQPGRRIALAAASMTIGRTDASAIVLADPEVSRVHCRIEGVGYDALVTDLGSSNGTFVEGKRVQRTAKLANGGTLRIGRQLLRHEVRDRRQVMAAEAMERDLTAAHSYIESLLPPRLTDGQVRTDWLFEPSASVGGDVLGYHAIDHDHFAMYLIDVAGHGAGAALHAAAVINILRKQALPGIDMRRPGRVMRSLNAMFPMEQHDGMHFTAWYGVYRHPTRELRYCSGGHHPGYLVGPERSQATPLATRSVLVGARRDYEYQSAATRIAAGSALYLFSDGLFEIEMGNGRWRTLDDFLPLLLEPLTDATEPVRLVEAVRRIAGRSVFEDDLTVLVVTFL
jgi:serine phosphatase RsbU (regulator of sigma subunit)